MNTFQKSLTTAITFLAMTTLKSRAPSFEWSDNLNKEFILKHGVNTADKDGYLPLIEAVMRNNLEIAAFLLQNGADVNAPNATVDRSTALLKVVGVYDTNPINAIKFLLQNKANVNAKDAWGQTALSQSVSRPEIVALLIQNGADVNAKDMTGHTPLTRAVGYPDAAFDK